MNFTGALTSVMYCCEKRDKDFSMNSSRRQKEIPVLPGKTYLKTTAQKWI